MVFFLFVSKKCLGYKKIKTISPSISLSTTSLLSPKSIQQKTYFSQLMNPENAIVVGLGPAGTGKTLFACHSAIQQLKEGVIQKIVVTRPSVSVDEDIGYLPGTVSKKMDPFTRPIFDIFADYYSSTQINQFVSDGTIEISTLGFMRGRTFKNAYLVADEMQNSSPSQMKMLLTRLGDGTRLAITGDLEQSDLGEKNGLRDFFSRIEHRVLPGIQWVRFSSVDIQRSPIVSTVVRLYDSANEFPPMNFRQ
jgi:phosphate starvation-inducible PhoH-like protein